MRILRNIIWLLFPVLGLAGIVFPSVGLQAQEGKTDLTLSAVGTYPGQVIPGQSNSFFLVVRNDGSTTINNIRFSAVAPAKWVVNFQPPALDSLGSGSSYSVIVYVIPDNSTRQGVYPLTMVAEANETQAATSTSFRVEDSSSSFWLWVGIGIGVVVVVGFVLVYLRFGKQ